MYDRPHYLLTLGGGQVTLAEEWQTGLRFAPIDGVDNSELLAAMDGISLSDIFDDFAAVITNADSNLAYYKSLSLNWIKLAPIGINGKYIGPPKTHSGHVTGFNQSSGTTVPQLAIVVSLLTGKSFGMAQKGRMYWPCPAQLPLTIDGTTGAFAETLSNQFAQLVSTALLAAEGEVDTQLAPVFAAVMSKSAGVTNPTGVGTTNAVTQVGVGRIIDTQRRRRGQLQDIYTPQPALAGTRDTLTPAPRPRSRSAELRSTSAQSRGTQDSPRGQGT